MVLILFIKWEQTWKIWNAHDGEDVDCGLLGFSIV
jgi:hypothetical protein